MVYQHDQAGTERGRGFTDSGTVNQVVQLSFCLFANHFHSVRDGLIVCDVEKKGLAADGLQVLDLAQASGCCEDGEAASEELLC